MTVTPNHSLFARTAVVFLVFLRLGLTSFGGPVAHLGFFREEFVARRRWLSDQSYTDIIALCQFLPGPASSQVGIAIGLSRAGWCGAIAAWSGFTLPSAVLLVLAVHGLAFWDDAEAIGMLKGFKLVAVAVVAHAAWGMARPIYADAKKVIIAVVAALIVVGWHDVYTQLAVIALAAVAGLLLLKPPVTAVDQSWNVPASRITGAVLLGVFAVLLIALPAIAALFPERIVSAVSVFYRAGSIVFGGGHVVLPVLQVATVPSGWIDNASFIAGYGLAQAVPGPLFTFAAFLGAAMDLGVAAWVGAVTCLLAIFVPSFLLVGGVLPFWTQLRRNQRAQAALAGINAAVIGLLLAALYQPVWTSAVTGWIDAALVLFALVAFIYWKLPAWLLVIGFGVFGRMFGAIL